MVELTSRLRHKVFILRRKLLKDGYGGVVEKWEKDGPIFASVEPLRASEYFKQSAIPEVEAQVEARIRVRFRRGLDPAAIRVQHGPTVYDVLGVIPDGQNYETQLMVKARALDQDQGEAVNP